MSNRECLPRLLVIDDLLGRWHPDKPNRERANLCGQYLLEDITGDDEGKGPTIKVKEPIAQAFFCRGQRPVCSVVGDRVENDLDGILEEIRQGWPPRRPPEPPWALALVDLCFYTGLVTEASNREAAGMPEGMAGDDESTTYFGLKVLKEIRHQFPGLPVVVFSSRSKHEVLEQYSDLGAVQFLPRETDRGSELLNKLIHQHAIVPDDVGDIVGHSIPLLIALRDARRMAASRQSVLLVGERGTGKELLARYVHRHRARNGNRPFVPVTSSVFTPELFASELFGIEKRVATEVDKRSGLIRAAHGGDLFLDEIRHLPPQVQASLLRVLEDRMVTSVGATTPQPVDVSFIFATNSNLDALCLSGGFIPDLLDRIRHGGTVWLPPLRDRMEDVPLLVELFLRAAEKEYHGIPRQVSEQAMDRLRSHHWPGNVRELRTRIYQAVRNYSDVERLSPVHIQIRDVDAQAVPTEGVVGRDVSGQSPGALGRARTIEDLDSIIVSLRTTSLDSLSRSRLAGKLRALHDAYACLVARLLKAGLAATSRPTPDNPEGKIQIHPAVKLLMGDSDLSASKAADLIKKFLALSPRTAELLLSDPLLQEALQKARTLRPPKSKRTRGGEK